MRNEYLALTSNKTLKSQSLSTIRSQSLNSITSNVFVDKLKMVDIEYE
jgi:hypothetical protein